MRALIRRFAFVLLLAVAGPALAEQGTAIVIGGALRYDNAAVWQRVVDAAGGKGARIAVFGTASGNPEASAKRIVETLNRYGAKAEAIPVSPRWPGRDLQATLNDPVLIEKVRTSGGVFFGGGAQALIVDTLQPDGKRTKMLDVIWEVYRRGGVVAGSSAGAAIMSRMMFRDAPDPLLVMKGGRLREGREVAAGLGFVGPDLFVDQHFLKRGRLGRLLPLMQWQGYRRGLGVEENSAAVVRGDEVEVIGAKGVLFVDLSEAATNEKLAGFNISNVSLSWLDSGDKLQLSTGVLTPSAIKLADPALDASQPDFRPSSRRDAFYPDMLADGVLWSAMTLLIDSARTEFRGLAFVDRPYSFDNQPDLGFEFRLYKGPGSIGWCSGAMGGDDCTVHKLRLDVRPVLLNRPWYSALQEGRLVMNRKVSGEFEVKMAPQDGPADQIGRMLLDKQFHGPLEAHSLGQMLAWRTATPGSAGYVAMERVTGELEGRKGSFVLQHSGSMDRGAPTLVVTVVPDSGTDGLTGINGRMTIRIEGGKHFYDFDYALPEAKAE
jgi:cyanophycinase